MRTFHTMNDWLNSFPTGPSDGAEFRMNIDKGAALAVDIYSKLCHKEVRDYQESLFFGLSLRQFIFTLLAVLVAVAVYFLLRNVSADVGWICILAAFPFALGSFFRYNGMNLEQFLWAFIRSALLCPKRLVFKSDNLYAKYVYQGGFAA